MNVTDQQGKVRCAHDTASEYCASLSREPAAVRTARLAIRVLAVATLMWAAGDASSHEPVPGALGIVALRSWNQIDAQVATEMILRKLSLPNPHIHGVFVKEVLPGLGGGVLKENDIIIRLANVKLDSEAQWERAQALLVEGKPVKVAFKRCVLAKDGSRVWTTSIEDIAPHSVADENAAKLAESQTREAAMAAREKHLSDLRDYVAAFPESEAEPLYDGPLPILPDGPKIVDGVEVQSKVGIVRDMIEACPEADIPLNELTPWVSGVTRSTLRDFMPREAVVVPGEIRTIYEDTLKTSGTPVRGVSRVLTEADRVLMNEAEEKYPGSFARLMSVLQMMFYLGPKQTDGLVAEWEKAQRHFFTAKDVEASAIRVPLEGGKEVLYWKKDNDLWHRFTLVSLDRNDIRTLRSSHPVNIAKKQREAEQERLRQMEGLAEAGVNAPPTDTPHAPPVTAAPPASNERPLKLWECLHCKQQHWARLQPNRGFGGVCPETIDKTGRGQSHDWVHRTW